MSEEVLTLTDAQKATIQEDMPRFKSRADVRAYIANPDPSLIVPKRILRDGVLVLNPEWEDAPYVQTLIWGPSKAV